MKFYYSPKYEIDIGQHVFPIIKYRLVHDRLIREKVARPEDFIDPGEATDGDLLLVHTPEYLSKLENGTFSAEEISRMEIPYNKGMVGPGKIFANGSIQAFKYALKNGVGVHIGGGFHHAYPDHGEGFCLINDIGIGIRKIQQEKSAKKVLVVDCDVHQGNGTAAIFKDDPNVFTFSIHQEHNYPQKKEKSTYDISVADAIGDNDYLYNLRDNLPKMLEEFKPDLIIFVAGADVYQFDQLGGLDLTISGLRKRDEYVFREAKKHAIPIATVYGGGYAQKVEDTVTIHVNTIKAALGL
ncbi:histone deacetylase [Candidatus Margulisiibacteriota bacterium]